MIELEKYELVNKCETAEELSEVILKISDNAVIKGRRKSFDADKMARRVFQVVNENLIPHCLTRQYGIRQQALYIKFYQLF